MFFLILIASGISGLTFIVLWVFSRRMQQQPLSYRASYRLLHGLLLLIVLLIVTMCVLGTIFWPGDWMLVVGAPLLATTVALVYLHIVRTPSLRTHRTARIGTVYLLVIGLALIWYNQNINPYANNLPVILATIGVGLTVAYVWQTVRGQSRWLWLGIGLLIAAVGVYDFAYNGTLNTWPGWLLWLLDVVSTFVLPVVLTALAGRVAAYLTETPRSIHWRRWIAGAIAAVLLMVLFIVHLVDMFLLDGFDDWGVILLPLLFGLAAITVTLMTVWTLQRDRIPVALAYLVVMGAAIYGLFAVTFNIDANPEVTTVARAEQVNQAIRAYYVDTGQYPANLYDLIPRYLLVIPNPVLYADQVWCYEGGDDSYRLASVYSPVWRAPTNSFTIRVHDSVGKPPSEHWMCDTLLVKYRERWGTPTS